jgi:hypothetical protein
MRRSFVFAIGSSAIAALVTAAVGCSSDPSPGFEPGTGDASTPQADSPSTPTPDASSPDTSTKPDAAPHAEGWDPGYILPGVAGRLHPTVNAIARIGNRQIALAGNFEQAGSVPAKFVALWNGNAWLSIGAGLPGPVDLLAPTSGGELYASRWDSSSFPGVTTIYKWNKATWSAVTTFDGRVQAIDVGPTGTLYVAGSFTKVGAQSIAGVAKYDGTTWSSIAGAPAVGVRVIRAVGTKICVGGDVVQNDNVGVRCHDGTSWSNYAFAPTGYGEINDIAEQNGSIVAAGRFQLDGMSSAGSLARWNAAASKWELVGGGLEAAGPADVRDMVVDGTKLYVTGQISYAGGTTVRHVAMWDTAVNRWFTLNDGIHGDSGGFGFGPPPGQVLAFDQGGEIYAGGGFSLIGGRNAVGIARWDGNQWNPVDDPKAQRLGVNGGVNEIATDGKGAIYAGGSFEFVGGDVAATHIAKLENDAWTPLGLGLDGPVLTIATQGTTVYAGGSFLHSGTVVTPNVAKWNGATWTGLGQGVEGDVRTLVVGPDGSLYAGGTFETSGSTPVAHIAMWTGTAWKTLAAGLDGEVDAIAFDASGKLYAGGWFTHSGATPIDHVALWDGAKWSAVGAGVNGSVYAIALYDGKLTIGGSFDKSGTAAVKNLAAWDGGAWVPVGGGLTNDGGYGTVASLSARGKELYVGGGFEIAGPKGDAGTGTPVKFVAKWNGTTWSDLKGGGASDVINVVRATKDSLWTGGLFTFAGGQGATNIGRYWFGP